MQADSSTEARSPLDAPRGRPLTLVLPPVVRPPSVAEDGDRSLDFGAAGRHGVGAAQFELFEGAPALPAGLFFHPDLLSAEDEAELLAIVAALPLHEARYKAYTAKRRIASYGTQYDFDANELQRGQPLPEPLRPLAERARALLGAVFPGGADRVAFTNALVAEYRPGTPLGWHRDVPDFDAIVGFSLAGSARMRLRRYPPADARRNPVVVLDLPPRSAYVLQGDARWGWQHRIAPTTELRYSITFRTPARRVARRA